MTKAKQGAFGPADILVDSDGSGGYENLNANQTYNGSAWESVASNKEVTVLASAARTATPTIADFTNVNASGVIVTIDCTAASATPSVVFDIKYKCSLSGKYVTLLSSAAVTGTGTTKLCVYPGVTVAANVTASHPLPRVWTMVATHADSDSITYSISANYIN